MMENSETACIENIWEELSKPLNNFIKMRVKSDQDVEDNNEEEEPEYSLPNNLKNF